MPRSKRPRADAADVLLVLLGGLASGVLELVDVRERVAGGARLVLELEFRRLGPKHRPPAPPAMKLAAASPLEVQLARRVRGLRPRGTSE